MQATDLEPAYSVLLAGAVPLESSPGHKVPHLPTLDELEDATPEPSFEFDPYDES